MAAYKRVLVGTDGSESSMLAVERAASLAAGADATLLIACAYVPADPRAIGQASDQLGEDAYQIQGDNPAAEIVRRARERAQAQGASRFEEHAVEGAPVESLLSLAKRENVELLVVGNKGINSLAGRLLGSVPAESARKAECDVLIVHTV